MYVTQISGAEATQLQYEVLTDPSPLEVTPDGWSPRLATIRVLATARTDVPVSKLGFAFFVGDGSSDLTTTLAGVGLNADPAGAWALESLGQIIAKPVSGRRVIVGDASYAFIFSGIRVNAATGITVLTITEEADGVESVAEFAIGKYPHGFQFGDFHPTTLEDTGGRKPRAYIEPGDTTTLKWFGSSGVQYTLLYDNEVIDVRDVRSWTSPKIVRDTTFHLKATLTDGGMSFDHYLFTAVSVHQPQVTLGTSSVVGSSAADAVNLWVNGRVRTDGTDPGIYFKDNFFIGSLRDGGSEALTFWTRADAASHGATRLRIKGGGTVEVLGRLEAIGLWCSSDRFIGTRDGLVGLFNETRKKWDLSVDGAGRVDVPGTLGVTGTLDVTADAKIKGNVGVGTTAPQARLHVHGNIAVTKEGKTATSGGMTIENFLRLDNAPGERFQVTGGYSRFSADAFGNGGEVYIVGGAFQWFNFGDKRYPAGYYTIIPSQHWPKTPPWTASSDRRLKTAVRPISDAMAKVGKLQGVHFRWNDTGLEHLTRDSGKGISAGPEATEADTAALQDQLRSVIAEELDDDNVGLIAQDVEGVLPELVDDDEHGYKSVDYARLSALLVEALKEQQAELSALKARVEVLEGAAP